MKLQYLATLLTNNIEGIFDSMYTLWVKKNIPLYFVCIFAKCWPIFRQKYSGMFFWLTVYKLQIYYKIIFIKWQEARNFQAWSRFDEVHATVLITRPLVDDAIVHCQHLTLCLKKVITSELSVTLSNLNRFSNFLHYWKAHEICYKMHTTISISP